MKRVDVRNEITIEGIPTVVKAVYTPENGNVFAVTARVQMENPYGDDGYWKLPNYSSKDTVKEGDMLPPAVFIQHGDKIREAAEEAADDSRFPSGAS